jgi:hypothetical protein
MPIVTLTQPLTLVRDDGTQQVFRAGAQEMEQADADHWYVKTCSTEPPPVSPPPVIDYGEMVKVQLLKSFTLTRDDGTTHFYRAGVQDMPQLDADHWYTKHHAKDAPPAMYPPGTPEYGQEQLRRAAEEERHRRAIEQEAEFAKGEVHQRAKRKLKRGENEPADADESIRNAEARAAEESPSRSSNLPDPEAN